MVSLIEMLGRSCPTIGVVDVGAMWLGMDLLAYKALLKGGVARVIGFEPVQAECDRLNKLGLKDHTYLPYFIGDGTERTFHLTNNSMTSSLYPPNTALLRKFQQLHEVTTIIKTERVQTRRLDEIPEIASIDYLKVDVQGADLDVLKGAQERLKTTVVVEVETEFVPLYEGQPLFADIDTYLRARGFLLHTINPPQGRAFKPLIEGGKTERPFRQVLWTDAVYVKDFMRLAELTPDQLLKMAVIVNDVYFSPDLAGSVLHQYDLKTKAGLWPIFMKRLLGSVPTETPVV